MKFSTKPSHCFFFALFTSILLFACKEEEENLPETITTLQLMVTDLSDPNLKVSNFYWKDSDADGPKPAIIDSINLIPNHEYAVEVKLLNEENGSMINMTGEIWAEKDDHLFLFKTSGIDLTTKVTDLDSKKLPVGLTSTFKAGAKSNGSMEVTLFHKSDKNNPYASGEQELSVIFPIKIK